MADKFTKMAAGAIKNAADVSAQLGHDYIGSEHLLIGLLAVREGIAGKVLGACGVTEEKIRDMISELIGSKENVGISEVVGYTPRTKMIIEASSREAERFGQELIGTEHILIAMLREAECIGTRLLVTLGINIQKLYNDILSAIGAEEDKKEGLKAASGSKGSVSTPTLDKYSRDLTDSAAEGRLDPVVGRDTEIQRVIQILSRRTKNNPCLIGEPGVGKTAIVEKLAQKLYEGNVPDTIRNKRLVTLDLSGMLAGSKYRGEFEERIKKVIEEVISGGDVLLFIDELHTIIGAGGAEGAMDASNILKPVLARGELQIIGATTIDEYRKHIEKDAALERRFQPVMVDEPSEEDAYEILKGLRPAYEKHHHVNISDDALEAAVKLSTRYINDRFLPDKAIDLVDEAASKARLSVYKAAPDIKAVEAKLTKLQAAKEEAIKKEAYEKAGEIKKEERSLETKLLMMKSEWDRRKDNTGIVIDANDIADIVSMWTKIPVRRLEEEESAKLLKLEKTLHGRVIGQDDAVNAVSKAIRRGRVGLKDPGRPIGSFLFLGPTGVGKTELSKALAHAMFGKDDAIVRIDMSEYMEKHSVSKLIGSPPGYVGYDEGGQLSEKIRRNPYSVVLFDEIEKAHPDVFNILLQVLDDGHITDAQGRRINFKNTIIIMTSNAGAANIVSPKTMGFTAVKDDKADYDRIKSGVMEEIKRIFKPEFINRIDDIIVFHPLNKDEVRKIVKLLLGSIEKRTKDQLDITLKATDGVIEHLLDKGFDPDYGARPMRRTIQNIVEDGLAEAILDKRIKQGDTVNIKMKRGEVVFAVK